MKWSIRMYEGILPIWKAAGMTSHDVVFKLRKILKMKKIGHTGTLDPDVEGVLLICLGKATKMVEFLMDGEKVYAGGICLGVSTETEDASGAMIDKQSVSANLSEEEIDHAMASMQGMIEQVPPYYSAVKVNGRKLYEYARAGEKVERPRRQVRIDDFHRTSNLQVNIDNATVSWNFYVACGKGTYVRTLAVDIGTKLGYPAHMSWLKRMATGGFTAKQTLTLEEVEKFVDNHSLHDKIYSVDDIKLSMPCIQIDTQQYEEMKYGKLLPIDYFGYKVNELTAVYYQTHLLGIYQPHPSKPEFMKPKKMIS